MNLPCAQTGGGDELGITGRTKILFSQVMRVVQRLFWGEIKIEDELQATAGLAEKQCTSNLCCKELVFLKLLQKWHL